MADHPVAWYRAESIDGSEAGLVACLEAAFEREIMRIGHHPDRFVEDPNLDDADDALRRRLRALHSHPG